MWKTWAFLFDRYCFITHFLRGQSMKFGENILDWPDTVCLVLSLWPFIHCLFTVSQLHSFTNIEIINAMIHLTLIQEETYWHIVIKVSNICHICIYIGSGTFKRPNLTRWCGDLQSTVSTGRNWKHFWDRSWPTVPPYQRG